MTVVLHPHHRVFANLLAFGAPRRHHDDWLARVTVCVGPLTTGGLVLGHLVSDPVPRARLVIALKSHAGKRKGAPLSSVRAPRPDGHRRRRRLARRTLQLGTLGRRRPARRALNLITPEITAAASATVRSGRTVSCARPLNTEPAPDNPVPVAHHMIGTATEGWGADYFAIAPHGFATSHIDALCHIFHDGKLFNGYDTRTVTAHGATRLGIHQLQNGIVTRGVLLDIPAVARRRRAGTRRAHLPRGPRGRRGAGRSPRPGRRRASRQDGPLGLARGARPVAAGHTGGRPRCRLPGLAPRP